MKHVKVLSSQKPASAEYTAWVELKNVLGIRGLSGEQPAWVATQWNDLLQK